MKRAWAWIGGVCLCGTLAAQTPPSVQKANYKLAEKFRKGNPEKTVFSEVVKPHFVGKGDSFWFSYQTTSGKNYYWVNPAEGKRRLLFDPGQMAAFLSEQTGKPCEAEALNLFPQFAEDGKSFRFMAGGLQFEYVLATEKCREVPRETGQTARGGRAADRKKSFHNTWSEDSAYIAYAYRHNVYVCKADEPDSAAVALTTGGEKGFSYSNDPDSEEGRVYSTMAQWLNGTHRLWALRTDNRLVEPLVLLPALSGRPKPKYIPHYAMAGDKNVSQYVLELLDADAQTVTEVNIGKWKDQKILTTQATRDGRYLYIVRAPRTRDELEVCRVNTETGKLEVLLNEVCKPYYNDYHVELKLINDDKEFLWWSERTGWGHYYLYAADGRLKGATTTGEWMANSIVRVDEKRRELWVMGHGREKGRSPYYGHLYRARLDGDGRVELLTPEDANHQVTVSPSGKYFVDTYSRVDLAPVSVLRNSRGKEICRLAETDLSGLYAMGWKMPERFTVKAADGVTELFGNMWKPYDFDSTKQYPIISYVYPGPALDAMEVDFTVSGNYNAALAQVGFIVVNFGHRGGTPLRGRDFRTFGYGNIRDFAVADDRCALEQLAARHSFIDINRVGIFGRSGGGFMTVAAIGTYPDFYKAAVAGSGNHDNRIYNDVWTETYHGVKEVKDKDGNVSFKFEVPTTMELAKHIKTPLLLFTGDMDNNVHPAQTIRLADALMKAGKQFEMYILPGEKHAYQGEKDVFYRRKMWIHFAKHLLNDYRAVEVVDMDELWK